MTKHTRLVYSTETGRIKAPTKHSDSIEEGDGIVRIFRENRKGSGVSIIKGLPASINQKDLAKILKKKLGVGGSIKEGGIEIQTDQREKIKELLEKEGLIVKIAGG
jgi:translation initiation factor 1